MGFATDTPTALKPAKWITASISFSLKILSRDSFFKPSYLHIFYNSSPYRSLWWRKGSVFKAQFSLRCQVRTRAYNLFQDNGVRACCRSCSNFIFEKSPCCHVVSLDTIGRLDIKRVNRTFFVERWIPFMFFCGPESVWASAYIFLPCFMRIYNLSRLCVFSEFRQINL